jgi:putative ABC transport system permease protein
MTEPIRLTGLSRQFQRGDNEVHALQGIDLTIEPGEFVALVGPSGSGKSTLLNLLGGLDRPTAGELWLNGTSLHSAKEKERTAHRRERVGFIFQSFNLLPRLTALENVGIPLMLSGVSPAVRTQRASAILQQVGLGHRLDHYPTELSGGEQQRVAIARALIHKPTLILADEPTGNLDSVTGEEVMSLLKTLNREQGITLIVVTHDEEVAAYADRIVKLRDGRIVEITQPNHSAPAKQVAVNEQANHSPQSTKAGLKLRDIVQTALQNLGRRRVRNILTAAGVLIGIITLVAMVSLGVGVQREVQRNFESVGLENIFVSPSFGERDDFDPFSDPVPETPLTPELVQTLSAMPNVLSVSPALSLPSGMDITLTMGETVMAVFVSGDGGTPFSFGPPGQSDLLAGEDPMASGEGLLLVAGLADRLLAEGQTYDDLVGQEVVLTVSLPRGESEAFASHISGIRTGFSTRSLDAGISERVAMVSWWFDEPDLLATQGYDQIVVRAANLSAVPVVTAAIEDQGLQAQSLEAILEVANQVLSLLQALLGSVGGLALLVAALGVANTMMMAIYERTREIGVLKALGASRREIRAMFTVEAGLIGLIGGIFGLILGTLLGRLVNWIAHQYLIREGVTGVGQLSIVPLWLAVGSLLFAALIGILAGLYPASRAAKLDPVTALRHE